MPSKPLWVWLPGQHEPTLAGTLTGDEMGWTLAYEPGYVDSGVAIDPIALKLSTRPFKSPYLPGVVVDAKPSGYGQDRLNARHGRDLSELELLEEGAGDGVGAIAVCDDISRKQGGCMPTLQDLESATRALDEHAPASRAIRAVNGDIETSAGGERPKMTLRDGESLWLAKMQDRGDRPGMPALEFLTMSLARECEITVPAVKLVTVGSRQVFLVERFDRHDSPLGPCRRFFASAHSVLRLPQATVRGDPRRSYLDFAYEARRWSRAGQESDDDMGELWKRMAFNALVGNVDDHARNHGLLLVDGTWRLAPAFDITPLQMATPEGEEPWPALAMAVHINGSTVASPHHLLASASAFGLDLGRARDYLRKAAGCLAESWEIRLREALAPLAAPADAERIVSTARNAFAMAEHIATQPEAVDAPFEALLRVVGKRSRAQKKG